ncbi:glutathione S-transferase [Phlyctochytrium arcticum]|nr:glutathione S-transferase [Phlyctochytrium arcticum]
MGDQSRADVIFYDLVVNPKTTPTQFFSPNTWKARLSLLHKQVNFSTTPVTLLDVCPGGSLASKEPTLKLSLPTIEIPSSGQLVTDSYRIAQWLEESYPDAPSLFSGDGRSTREVSKSDPQITTLGKSYARMMDLGLGASDPQWAIWFDLFFPEILRLNEKDGVPGLHAYFSSDDRLGPNGAARLLALDRSELTTRAQHTVLPFITILKERPGEYLQGRMPGYVDYVVFGRYAYGRLLNAQLNRKVWEEQAPELAGWVDQMCALYGGHAASIFAQNGC